jgi:hypothetical protein
MIKGRYRPFLRRPISTGEPIMSTVETVKVKHPTAGYMIINKSDLTDDHELFDAPKVEKKPEPEKRK